MSSATTSGIGITTSRKIQGGRVVTEEVVQLPTIEELRETLSYRGSEDQSFRWRGQVLAYGKWDPKAKQYVLDHPLNVIKDLKTWDVNFPTWVEAYKYLDEEKEEILAGILTLIELEEDE